MTREPVRVMAPDRWDRLLRTAAHEFASAGYQQASLNRIIQRVGMSKSSFYHFVASKEQLFDAVLAEYGPALVEAAQPPDLERLAGDFWGELSALVGRLLDAASREPVFPLLGRMWYLPGAPTDAGSALGRSRAGLDDWLQRAIEVGRSAGAVRHDLPAELQGKVLLAVVRVFDEWSLNNVDPTEDRAELVRVARAQLAAIRRLLGADAAATG